MLLLILYGIGAIVAVFVLASLLSNFNIKNLFSKEHQELLTQCQYGFRSKLFVLEIEDLLSIILAAVFWPLTIIAALGGLAGCGLHKVFQMLRRWRQRRASKRQEAKAFAAAGNHNWVAIKTAAEYGLLTEHRKTRRVVPGSRVKRNYMPTSDPTTPILSIAKKK